MAGVHNADHQPDVIIIVRRHEHDQAEVRPEWITEESVRTAPATVGGAYVLTA